MSIVLHELKLRRKAMQEGSHPILNPRMQKRQAFAPGMPYVNE